MRQFNELGLLELMRETPRLDDHPCGVIAPHSASLQSASAMTIGASLFLIAVGAILKFAVTASVAGIELDTVGLILMVIGAAGLLITLTLMAMANRHAGPRPPYDGSGR